MPIKELANRVEALELEGRATLGIADRLRQARLRRRERCHLESSEVPPPSGGREGGSGHGGRLIESIGPAPTKFEHPKP